VYHSFTYVFFRIFSHYYSVFHFFSCIPSIIYFFLSFDSLVLISVVYCLQISELTSDHRLNAAVTNISEGQSGSAPLKKREEVSPQVKQLMAVRVERWKELAIPQPSNHYVL
jgi:hypothetical protein